MQKECVAKNEDEILCKAYTIMTKHIAVNRKRNYFLILEAKMHSNSNKKLIVYIKYSIYKSMYF